MDIESMNASQIDALAKSLAAKAIEMKAADRKAEREARQAAERARNEAHYALMLEEIGQPLAGLNEAQHGAVYAMAWEHGHASGYSEVENYYGDFAELARRVIEAA